MIELTDLQEDILTLAVENPEMTNEEIAEILDCSEEWVGEVRRKYEQKVSESKVSQELQTVAGTAKNPPQPGNSVLDTDEIDTFDVVMVLFLLLIIGRWAMNQGLI
ncbi:Lrp/AsnC family transcriptional regulator [Halorussus marinus]|uniref:Lrp/AsnC family transcriptional regulator n=1 Tax=Halorussus marinus TaxID=2505976 RepID=UPI001091B61F|nr:Lrp/AsnC family transcriptional regulator [Halorussus marinus]